MNELFFLKTYDNVVLSQFETDVSLKYLRELISSDFFSDNINVYSIYLNENILNFNPILNIDCKLKNSQSFKMKWIVRNKIHRIIASSNVDQSEISCILDCFMLYLKNKITLYNLRPTVNISTNGLAMTRKKIDLHKLSKFLDNTKLSFVNNYKLDSTLKIYHENGTISVNKNGKIVYLGSKTEEQLIKLHETFDNICFKHSS